MCMKSNRCILYFHSIHSSKTVYNTSKTTILPNHLNAHSTTTVVKHITASKKFNHLQPNQPTTLSQTTVVKPKQKYIKISARGLPKGSPAVVLTSLAVA